METALTNSQTEEERMEFGFERTRCACSDCALNCKHLPGYLVPADVERIARRLGYTNLGDFAFDNLLASVGATVMNAEGQVFQIPTLVPRRKSDGSCVFLDERDRCTIHSVSPFGCSFFDAHQSDAEANARSGRGLREIAREWAAGSRSAYAVLWRGLFEMGLRAVPPGVARRRMKEAEGNKRSLSK